MDGGKYQENVGSANSDNQIVLSNCITIWKAAFLCVRQLADGRSKRALFDSANIIFYCEHAAISERAFVHCIIRLCSPLGFAFFANPLASKKKIAIAEWHDRDTFVQ